MKKSQPLQFKLKEGSPLIDFIKRFKASDVSKTCRDFFTEYRVNKQKNEKD
ncbi:MAG: hypothetical protein WC119_00840 [Synergistaceae bacterium]